LLSLLPLIYGWYSLSKNIQGDLVTSGAYAYSRNPQYVGFILFVVGMTLYWSTLITIPMGLILCLAYYRLAISEEKKLAKMFEEKYVEYSKNVPRFLGGRSTLKIFRLPTGLTLIEVIVEAALLTPFIFWFAEALLGVVAGSAFVESYWYPIAYILPIHIGVVISLALLFTVTLALVKQYISKRKK
jgi:hypothetical protein